MRDVLRLAVVVSLDPRFISLHKVVAQLNRAAADLHPISNYFQALLNRGVILHDVLRELV